MPNNNVNNYRIRSGFSFFIQDLPGLKVVHTESVEFINVRISQSYERNSFAFFGASSRFPQNGQYYLLDQLFKELEKDRIDARELIDIGSTFKKYLLVLKQIDNNHAYYTLTPGMMAGFFIVLHFTLLFFPENKPLIYTSLITDFYGLGFWLFSIWSFSKYGQVLRILEDQLIEKINFLKSLSPDCSFSMQVDPYYLGSSASMLPTYGDVLLEDAMCTEPTLSVPPTYFYSSVSDEYESDTDNMSIRQERRSHSI